MVYDGPQMPSIFPNSGAYGEGFRQDTTVRRRNDGGFGASKISLLHSDAGFTTSPTLEVLDLIQFAIGDINIDEEVWVEISVVDASTGAFGGVRLRAEDSVGNTITGNILDAKEQSRIKYTFVQDPEDNTNMNGISLRWGTNISTVKTTFSLTDKDIIKSNWTLSLEGNVNTAGTLYYKWWVYRRSH